MSILAYDCEGKPIRAGDRCLVVGYPGYVGKHHRYVGRRVLVLGRATDEPNRADGCVTIDIPAPGYECPFACAPGDALRVEDGDPNEHDTETDIWTPEGVEA